MTQPVLLLVAGVSVVLFAVAAWFTRASPRRIAAAALGSAIAGVVNVVWDLQAFEHHWWHYTFMSAARGPWIMYAPAGLVFGGALGLVGWRIIRRFGWLGALGFFLAFTLLGFARDNVYSARGDVFVFDPGWPALAADLAGYLSLALVVQITMLVLVGKPTGDRLRGEG